MQPTSFNNFSSHPSLTPTGEKNPPFSSGDKNLNPLPSATESQSSSSTVSVPTLKNITKKFLRKFLSESIENIKKIEGASEKTMPIIWFMKKYGDAFFDPDLADIAVEFFQATDTMDRSEQLQLFSGILNLIKKGHLPASHKMQILANIVVPQILSAARIETIPPQKGGQIILDILSVLKKMNKEKALPDSADTESVVANLMQAIGFLRNERNSNGELLCFIAFDILLDQVNLAENPVPLLTILAESSDNFPTDSLRNPPSNEEPFEENFRVYAYVKIFEAATILTILEPDRNSAATPVIQHILPHLIEACLSFSLKKQLDIVPFIMMNLHITKPNDEILACLDNFLQALSDECKDSTYSYLLEELDDAMLENDDRGAHYLSAMTSSLMQISCYFPPEENLERLELLMTVLKNIKFPIHQAYGLKWAARLAGKLLPDNFLKGFQLIRKYLNKHLNTLGDHAAPALHVLAGLLKDLPPEGRSAEFDYIVRMTDKLNNDNPLKQEILNFLRSTIVTLPAEIQKRANLDLQIVANKMNNIIPGANK